MSINDVLKRAFELKAADVFLIGGLPITYKVNGRLIKEGNRFDVAGLTDLIRELYDVIQRPFDEDKREDDFSFSLSGLARFRCNIFYQRGTISAVIRVLQFGIPTKEELNIPNQLLDICDLTKGLVLITGATGTGKSSTIACLLDEINHKYEKNIITMEDPIEFIHRHDKSIIIQREIPTDTDSFASALKASLREAPDILFVGEMRDPETIATAMTAAETGRLVISTLHTISAADTIDRVVDSFPYNQQAQIRNQLSRVLRYVVCQQLVPGIDGKLHPAFEILKVTYAVSNLIREGKTVQIPNIMQTSRSDGMNTMADYLSMLERERIIDRKTARIYTDDINDFYK